ncbi:hypothetical protein [Ekhidna sp.]|uniref:tetratricopeptide repeat protein n=1 Tax=Ekhidna sp. TaxID=2608089 RepID=UPI0032EE28D2
MKVLIIYSLICLLTFQSFAQDLNYGSHNVGFRILTFIDSTRVMTNEPLAQPENRYRTIKVHIWYPTSSSSNYKMTTEKYMASQKWEDENGALETLPSRSLIHGNKNAMRSWFGAFEESDWEQLRSLEWEASIGADYHSQKFPLLIGELRPTSTFITNEYLASHGFIVAYVRQHDYESQSHQYYPVMSKTYINMARDMEFVTMKLRKMEIADQQKLGTIGFSGSGFAQVHFAMLNVDVDAIADIESGYFMEGLYEGLTALSSYDPQQIRVPFLHIFSRKLTEEEIFLDSLFLMKYADIYRLILGKPQHHWDFASEGYLAAKHLNNRKDVAQDVIESFHIFNDYLKHFFDASLKGNLESQLRIQSAQVPVEFDPELVTMEYTPRQSNMPNLAELKALFDKHSPKEVVSMMEREAEKDTFNLLQQDIFSLREVGMFYQRRGDIDKALAIAKILLIVDPENQDARGILDNLGYMLLSFEMKDEALRVFLANVENYPEHHIPRYSLGDYYQQIGKKGEALEQFEKGIKLTETATGYPENLLNAHKNAFKNKIDQLKNR